MVTSDLWLLHHIRKKIPYSSSSEGARGGVSTLTSNNAHFLAGSNDTYAYQMEFYVFKCVIRSPK